MKWKLTLLSCLYFVQGLPYGFQISALPVYLRSEGVSLAGIGMAGALSLPWVFKVVWGPAVDRFSIPRWGRRRSWILPLQLLLMLSCLVASMVEPSRGLMALLSLVFAMNLFASTMDVAVDGLAVDVLRTHELGHGNIAQVVGYKLGMLAGGGLLVWASPWLGWQGIFLAMSALVGCVFLITLFIREPSIREPSIREPNRRPTTELEQEIAKDSTENAKVGGEQAAHVVPLEAAPDSAMPLSMISVLKTLRVALQRPGALWLLLFIGTYKLGETMADTMFKPFLYDAGFRAEQIGLWVGTWGLIFSLVGSFAGGWAASRIGIFQAVAWAAVFRALAVAGEWWLSWVEPTVPRVVSVISMEQFFGGALTTAIFAFMMSRVDRSIGATHFTFLATVEVAGKLSAAWISGFVAQSLGYTSLFGLATFFAMAFLVLLIPIRRAIPA